MKCPHCESDRLQSKGLIKLATGETKRKMKCKDCGKVTSFDVNVNNRQDKAAEINKKFVSSPDELAGYQRYVVTSCQNDTPINEEFLQSLLTYCAEKEAKLLVIPIRYKNPNCYDRMVSDTWPTRVAPYMMDATLDLGMAKIVGDLKIQATMQSPLNGLEALTQGKTTIVGHSQIQLKSCPRLAGDHPIILTSTGTISEKNYSDTRMGYVAQFHHSFGAVVVEMDYEGEAFHIRHLVGDDDGSFIDLGVRYDAVGSEFVGADALVTGDEHAMFADDEVKAATYFDEESIVRSLKPKTVVRHDIVDSYTISHHHEKSFFHKVAKHQFGLSLERELDESWKHLKETSAVGDFKNVIVESNHNSHLFKWLNDDRSAKDAINARIYTKLRGMVLDSMSGFSKAGIKLKDPFVLWINERIANEEMEHRFQISSGGKSIKIQGIEISLHGDSGFNGSRGSAKQLSRLSSKTVIGHSHSPCIERGCYQVGTSTGFDLEYTKSLTSWMNTHCVIYPNGKRQLINIINGQWRLRD